MKLGEILSALDSPSMEWWDDLDKEVVVQIDDRVYTVEDVLVKVENQTIYLEVE